MTERFCLGMTTSVSRAPDGDAGGNLRRCRALRLLAAAVGATGLLNTAPVAAEGSASLYPAGYEAAHPDGGRGDLDVADQNAVGNKYLNVVPRRSFIYVYAQQDEYILLGSRNRTADAAGVIKVYNPQSFGTKGLETIPAAADFTCTTGTTGLIDTRANELAGAQSVDGTGNTTAGYVPCFYKAPRAGVYGVLFSGNSGGTGATGSVAAPGVGNGQVSAWDVSVRSSDPASVVNIDGRAFTYALSVNTGGNQAGRRLYSDLYYVTDDGYRYRQSLQGLDPNAGTLFANPLGFRDQGTPLYKDIRGTNQPVSTGIPAGVTADNAQFPIFFSSVAQGGAPGVDATLGALGITLTPKPPQVNSFGFAYPPTSGSTSFLGQGGTFSFTVTDTISFQIVISRDAIDFDPANPVNRVLTGVSGTGPYSVVWDGKDNAGNNFPVGTNYQFRITGRNGEAHFPFVDVEGNLNGGPILTKLNGNVIDALVYYDDRGYVTKGGTIVGAPNGQICGQATWPQPTPVVSLIGLDSSAKIYNNGSGPNSAYARWWPDSGSNPNLDCNSATQYFGDTKALNLWTYQTTSPQGNTLSVIDTADVRATISAPVSTSAGSSVSTSIGFGNVGSQTANGVTYTATLPPGLSGVNCVGATCSYNAASGVVAITGLPLSLSSGQSVNLSLSYTAPASGNVNATATVGTSTGQGPNLAPDSASATTLIGGSNAADVLTTVSPPPSAAANGAVSVPVTFANVGPTAAPITGYGLQLPPGLTNVGCSGSSVVCNYDSGTGAVVLTGLPASLAPGQSAPFTLTYTAPAAGLPVKVTSTIATSATETNTANNSASGITTTLGNSNEPDVVASVMAPTTATPGSTVDVPVTFGNVGDVAAAGITYALTLPTGLSGVNCLSPAVCSYNAGSGAVTVNGLPTTLNPGGFTNLTLRYTAPSSGVVPATATIQTTTNGETNTGNNTATGNTTIVTASSGADVTAILNAPANAAPGAPVSVPVTFSNLGPVSAAGVTYSLTLPPGLSGVVGCTPPVNCSYNSGTGVVTVSGLPTTLTSGQSEPVTLNYAAPASGRVPVSASISTATYDPNSGNNTASGTTAVAAGSALADVTTAVSPPPSAVAGSTVNVPVNFSNVGSNTAAAVGYQVALTGSPTGVSVSNGGTACSYSSGTGLITGCGLPTTLSPGQSVNLTATYTAPATGPVGITSTIATSTGESNPNNNTANASTAISPAPAPDLAISLANLPGTATAGSPYSGSFTCTNGGNAAATAGTSCTVSGLPAGVTVGACTISPTNALWNAGNAVPVAQTVTCAVAGTPATAGSTTINGTTSATGDSNAANDTATKLLATNPAAASATDLLTTVQAPPSAAPGSTVNVPVTFANVGIATVPVTSYTLTLAPGLSGVVCTGGSVGCAYDSGSGVVTLSGLPTSLASGQNVPFTLTYTGPVAGTAVTVTSTIATSAAEANNGNNTASATTTTVGTGSKPDVLASVVGPATAVPGATVSVPVTFGNAGDVPAAGIGYALTLANGLSGVSCAAPVTCTYDSTSGNVTATGLPTTLASGTYTGLTLVYTAPTAGVIPAKASITTTTAGETNTTNNTATGNTTVVPAQPSADVSITVSPPASAAPGSPVNVPITVANQGPLNAANVGYTLNLPTGLTSVACTPVTVTCSYSPATGVVTLSGLPTTLTPGQSVPFTLTYTPSTAGQIPVNATISTSTFDGNSGNNTASGTTVVGLADVGTSVTAPSSAVSGSVVNVPVAFSNAGAVTAAGVAYNIALNGAPAGATVTNGGTACNYTGGAVTGCGLPATLTAGQTVNLTVSYTVPATGPVVVTSTIGTSTTESNTTNNTASGSTAVTPVAPTLTPDMGIDLGGLPETATVGQPYSGTFRCTNSGSAVAASGTLCSLTGLPAGVTLGTCSLAADSGNVGKAGTPWVPGAAVGVSQTVQCTVSGTPTGVGVSNPIGTTGAAGDGNTANNSATHRITVAAAAMVPPPAEVQSIPTLSEWTFMLLAGLLAMVGMVGMRAQQRAKRRR